MVKESSGCEVGDEHSERENTLDDFVLPKGGTVTVEVQQRMM